MTEESKRKKGLGWYAVNILRARAGLGPDRGGETKIGRLRQAGRRQETGGRRQEAGGRRQETGRKKCGRRGKTGMGMAAEGGGVTCQ
eukprot:723187-Rhodomonas_salina.1